MHKRMIRALAVLLVFVASLFAKDKPFQPPSHPPKATKFKSRKMKGKRTMKSRSTRPKTIKRKAPSKPRTNRRHTQNR